MTDDKKCTYPNCDCFAKQYYGRPIFSFKCLIDGSIEYVASSEVRHIQISPPLVHKSKLVFGANSWEEAKTSQVFIVMFTKKAPNIVIRKIVSYFLRLYWFNL